MSAMRQVARRAKRQSKIWYNRMFRGVDRDKFKRAFRELGLGENDLVVVHTSLSRFGYVEGGADSVIEALFDVVGPGGTAAMPTFTFNTRNLGYMGSKAGARTFQGQVRIDF